MYVIIMVILSKCVYVCMSACNNNIITILAKELTPFNSSFT